MLAAAVDAVEFTAPRSPSDLRTDRQLGLAIVKCIEIIGEAANQVSADTRDALQEIAWTDIIGMRHRLVHGYYDIDYDIVASTVTGYLPPLIAMLQRIVTAARDAEERA